MSGLRKRLERLEAANGPEGYLQILTLGDLVVGDSPALPWPETTRGVRSIDGGFWSDAEQDGHNRWRHDGESIDAFRERLCREHGVRGPAGALPFAFVDLIVSGET